MPKTKVKRHEIQFKNFLGEESEWFEFDGETFLYSAKLLRWFGGQVFYSRTRVVSENVGFWRRWLSWSSRVERKSRWTSKRF